MQRKTDPAKPDMTPRPLRPSRRRTAVLATSWLMALLLPTGLSGQNPAPLTQEVSRDTANPEVGILIDKAAEHAESGELRRASKLYEKAVAVSGGRSAEALLGLANNELRRRRYALAIESARSALEVAKGSSRAIALNTLGLAILSSGQHSPERLSEAADALREAIKISGSAPIYLSLSNVHLAQRAPTQAAEALRQAIALDAESWAADQARLVLCRLRAQENLPGPGTGRGGNPSEVAVFTEEGAATDRPEPLYSPNPQYTKEARKARIQGVVIAQVMIDTEGCVTQVKIIQGLEKGLTEAAEEVLLEWIFRPARRDGEPFAVWYDMTTNFRLN